VDAVEHAEIHAKDFIAGGIQFDFRHEGWPFLSEELREACKAERSRRMKICQNGENNPMYGKKRPDRKTAWEGDKNPNRKPENKEKLRRRMSGNNNHMHGKFGELNPFYGKTHTEETKKLLSELAKTNPSKGMEGKSHSEEAKEKMKGPRAKMKGKKHWVNAQGKTCRSRECPGPEWQRGRKWRPQ